MFPDTTYISLNGSDVTSCLLGGNTFPCRSIKYVVENAVYWAHTAIIMEQVFFCTQDEHIDFMPLGPTTFTITSLVSTRFDTCTLKFNGFAVTKGSSFKVKNVSFVNSKIYMAKIDMHLEDVNFLDSKISDDVGNATHDFVSLIAKNSIFQTGIQNEISFTQSKFIKLVVESSSFLTGSISIDCEGFSVIISNSIISSFDKTSGAFIWLRTINLAVTENKLNISNSIFQNIVSPSVSTNGLVTLKSSNIRVDIFVTHFRSVPRALSFKGYGDTDAFPISMRAIVAQCTFDNITSISRSEETINGGSIFVDFCPTIGATVNSWEIRDSEFKNNYAPLALDKLESEMFG